MEGRLIALLIRLLFKAMEWPPFQWFMAITVVGIGMPSAIYVAYQTGDRIYVGVAALLVVLTLGVVLVAVLSRMFPDIDPKAKERREAAAKPKVRKLR